MKIDSSAPGKILLLGSYSVLEGGISYVITTDARVHASIKENDKNEVVLLSPQFGKSITGKIIKDKNKVEFTDVPSEMKLFSVSSEIAIKYLIGIGVSVSGIEISVKNDKPLMYSIYVDENGEKKVSKTGLGSSAALTVSVIGGILKFFTNKDDLEVVHKLAQLANYIFANKIGSGFDIASAVYGSIMYKRFSEKSLGNLNQNSTPADIVRVVKKDWDYDIKKIKFPDTFKLIFVDFKGESTSTRQFVAQTYKLKEKNPEYYNFLIKSMDNENVSAIKYLDAISKGNNSESNLRSLRDSINMGRIYLKNLGISSEIEIEDDQQTKLIDLACMNGAYFGKLPGSGGKDAVVFITKSDEDKLKLNKFINSNKQLGILNIEIDNRGLVASSSKLKFKTKN